MTSNAEFLWSDAWLLEAIVVASSSGKGSLTEIIGAADAINHAILCDDEIHGGLVRLVAGGFIDDDQGRFRPTALVPSNLSGRDGYRKLLRAEEWSPSRSTKQPENQGVAYPGLTAETIERAIREYQQRARRSL